LPRSKGVDAVVVGAGVIGMATALELAQRGAKVRIFDRGRPGGESSWAGAGIIYPASPKHAANPFERLRGVSHAAWPSFAEKLNADVGFIRCGGIILEPTKGDLERIAAEHRSAGAVVELCDASVIERNLQVEDQVACYLPEVCQVRNPWLVRALAAKLESLDVEISHGTAVRRILDRGGQVVGIETESGRRIASERVLLSAGAWTSTLVPNISMEIVPIRGQILLFKPRKKLLTAIVDAGKHYFVPRAEGRILVGSTEEHAGFNKGITTAGFEELYSFAVSRLPALADSEIEASWSGLRPGTPTGTPYLFEDKKRRGLWIAAGHFRLGLQLAPGTALLLADWLTGTPSFAEPSDFDPTVDRAKYQRSFTA
jgi:glycine oxidase